MNKSNILTIVISILAGLLVSCFVLVDINLMKDNKKNLQVNSKPILEQELNTDIEKKNDEDQNQIKTTENTTHENIGKSNPISENEYNEKQDAGNIENNQEVKLNVQQQSINASNANIGISSSGTIQNQTKSVANDSSNNKSNNTNSKKSTNETTQPVNQKNNNSNYYILNKNTKVFHISNCKSVKKMKNSNKIEFHGSRNEAISKGYRPCQNCYP